MCSFLGISGWVLFGVAYAAGAVTLPVMKAGWAKIKAWIEAHK